MINIIKPDEKIIGFLEKNRIQNLNILGYLANHKDTVAWVFDGEIDNGVIIATGKPDIADINSELFYVDTVNKKFLREFWDSLPAGHKVFSGVPEHIAEIIYSIAGEPAWCNKCNVFALTGHNDFVTDTEFAEYNLTSVNAREVDEYYTYKSENSYSKILDSIKNRDSAAVKIDGELAAWILTHDDNSMGPLYVKERFRGRRLAKTVSEWLMKKLFAKNIIPFAQIVVNNEASHANMKKIKGMEFSHVCVWFGIDKNI